MWRSDGPQGNEAAKVKWELPPYTRGRVLDIGCGPYKTFPHFVGIDNGHHDAAFGWQSRPDLKVDSAADLGLIATASCDAVFSSHLLEHFEYAAVPAVLAEWMRVVKIGGHLILYLPDEDDYPKVGERGANPDHKWNVNVERVMRAMPDGFDLVRFEKRNAGDEYSLFFVFRKTAGGRRESWKRPQPAKTALVVRFGAFGDMLQASSVFAGLKEQGYHVTVMGSYPGLSAVEHDPHVDEFIVLDKDQVPNHELGPYFDTLRKKYERFVNLCEAVEVNMLTVPGRSNHSWPDSLRRKLFNHNYLEVQHALAEVPHKPAVKFYATEKEKSWARSVRARMDGPVVLWSVNGSSVNKVWPYIDPIIRSLLHYLPDVHIVLCGGPESKALEKGWEGEPRVMKTCGVWGIRETLAFIEQADVVMGPETGVLNGASQEPVAKIIFLSHSSHENLTRDWVNTIALTPPASVACYPCHKIHYDWSHCHKHQDPGAAGATLCQGSISVDQVWEALKKALLPIYEARGRRSA